MQPKIVFCVRCRGMKVGWNNRYFRIGTSVRVGFTSLPGWQGLRL